jgi:predicted DNA-binding transcriptional regulator YafY
MRRADRLFQLVQLLRAKRMTTAELLAEELRVSKRTVYRDIADLQRSGIPVRGEAGVGYRLERGFELPPLTFNSEEIEALVIGARMVEAFGDPELAKSARSAMTKVEAVLPGPLRRVLQDTALFAPAMPWHARRAEGLQQLRRATTERRKLSFDYVRADGVPSVRTVRPLGLYFWGNAWSLAAWCELREQYRNFRPDRMARVELLTDRFDGSDGIDLAGFAANMRTQRDTEDHPVVRGGSTEG